MVSTGSTPSFNKHIYPHSQDFFEGACVCTRRLNRKEKKSFFFFLFPILIIIFLVVVK